MNRYQNIMIEDDLDSILEFNIEATDSQVTFETILPNDILLGSAPFLNESSSKDSMNMMELNRSNDTQVSKPIETSCGSIGDSGLDSNSMSRHIHFNQFNTFNISPPNKRKKQDDEQATNEFSRHLGASIRDDCLSYNVSDIPESIVNLFKDFQPRLSNFSFVYAISAQMCQGVMPMECYVEFKIGLLLSLASIRTSNNATALHIVGIGPDTSFANLLMTQVGNLASRFLTSIDKFQSSASKSTNVVEASPLLLSKGGVYYLGDWTRLNEGTQSKIVRDINCNYVVVDNVSVHFSLDSAIWCYWRNYKNNLKDMKSLGTLLKIFGIPFILEESALEKLANFLLERAISPNQTVADDDLSISIEDMKTYLKVISGRNVEMPKACAELLRNYFIASRYERPECLSERAFLSLKQMSESFARLSFRDHVILTDVIGAIYLCEHFIKNVFGPGLQPPPVVCVGNDIEHVEDTFKNFQRWVFDYITKFTPNCYNSNIK